MSLNHGGQQPYRTQRAKNTVSHLGSHVQSQRGIVLNPGQNFMERLQRVLATRALNAIRIDPARL